MKWPGDVLRLCAVMSLLVGFVTLAAKPAQAASGTSGPTGERKTAAPGTPCTPWPA
jgi:hypothetical protein